MRDYNSRRVFGSSPARYHWLAPLIGIPNWSAASLAFSNFQLTDWRRRLVCVGEVGVAAM